MSDFDSRASVAMHELVPPHPDDVTLFDEVAKRAARRRRAQTRVTAIGACVAVLAAVAIVSWGSHRQTSSPASSGSATATGSPSVVAAPSCAKTLPDRNSWLAGNPPAKELVPGAPVVATACRYYGFDVPHPQGALAASITVQEDASTWAKVFNSGQRVPAGDTSCPSDSGNSYLVEFAYRDRPSMRVEVDGSGCGWASNGRVTRYGAGLPLLEQALGADVPGVAGAVVVPTWDSSRGGPTAGIRGTLSGQVKRGRLCALISVPGQPKVPVVWPAGSRAEQVGVGWVVLSAAGKKLGSPGQHVSFPGGWVPVVLVRGTLRDAGCLTTDQVVLYTP